LIAKNARKSFNKFDGMFDDYSKVFRGFDVNYHTYYNIGKMFEWKTIIILEEGRFHINNKHSWKKFWRKHNKGGWLWVTFEKRARRIVLEFRSGIYAH
jgi:hypothetical protein